jgi:hypothetical protein
MDVNEIELPVSKPAAYARGAERAEVHASYRPVIRDWHGRTDAGKVFEIKGRG